MPLSVATSFRPLLLLNLAFLDAVFMEFPVEVMAYRLIDWVWYPRCYVIDSILRHFPRTEHDPEVCATVRLAVDDPASLSIPL